MLYMHFILNMNNPPSNLVKHDSKTHTRRQNSLTCHLVGDKRPKRDATLRSRVTFCCANHDCSCPTQGYHNLQTKFIFI
uniref:Uncharacterized protein n=1 Tax=Arundo donax TaxID=35708 RepID=A0A0A9F4S6_ARUDO